MASPLLETDRWGSSSRLPRYDTDLQVSIAFQTADGENRIVAQAFDIGIGGMAVFIPRYLPVGSIIDLNVEIPTSENSLRISGMVRHRHEFLYGIAFQNTTERQRSCLISYCANLSVRVPTKPTHPQ